MSSFIVLSKIVVRLDKLSNTVVKMCLPFLQEMEDDDCDIFVDVADKLGDDNTSEGVSEKCRDISLTLVDCAHKTKKEIGDFIVGDKQNFSIREDLNSFLFSVWSGDVYDVEGGEENLERLVSELEEAKRIFSSRNNFVEYLVQMMAQKQED